MQDIKILDRRVLWWGEGLEMEAGSKYILSGAWPSAKEANFLAEQVCPVSADSHFQRAKAE